MNEGLCVCSWMKNLDIEIQGSALVKGSTSLMLLLSVVSSPVVRLRILLRMHVTR